MNENKPEEKFNKKKDKTSLIKVSYKVSEKKVDLNPYKVNFFNIWVKAPKKLVFAFLSALLYNLGVAIFLSKAATVASGVSAIVQGLTYTIEVTSKYFAFIYLGLNIPLVLAFWNKNQKMFMLLTMYWLLFQVIIQSIFLIKPVGNFLDKISIFYTNWTSPGTSWNNLQPWRVYHDSTTWPILVYTLIGGACAGTAAGIAWKNSGSTGGSDIIINYVSRMKKKSIGKVSTVVALIFAAVSIFVIGLVEGLRVNPKKTWNPGAFLLRVICTILYIFIFNGLIELIYPKYKKIKIEIYTYKGAEIIAHLQSINYWHGYNYSSVTSGYSHQEVFKIETNALYLEQNLIKNEILKIDPNAFISITIINKIIGSFNTYKVD